MAVDSIQTLLTHAPVQAARERFVASRDEIIEHAITIQQIPAPTGAEGERAAWVCSRFEQLCLADVRRDALGNVYARRPGRAGHPAVIVAAHLDTVFSAETDLRVRRDRATGRIYGPGLGDNSLGVAGLLVLAEVMQDLAIPTPGDVWFVADVGEEGLGNLRGMCAVTNALGDQVSAVIAVEGGGFGMICHQGIGVRRLRIEVRTPGGHAWSDFGVPSAVHTLLRLGAALTEMQIPPAPMTTFNIGIISGGTTINTIAHEAHLLLDLRSEATPALNALEEQTYRIVAGARRQAADGVEIEIEQIGNRPSGHIPRDHALTRLATAALEAVEIPTDQIGYRSGSTDANIPLSRGIPALCLGLTDTYNAHRTDEFIEPTRLPQGLTQLLLVVLAAAGGLMEE
ncbi:MAG: M20/M25/M40 family metallo-hydrolase [Ardenticatenaceae bacterium]|nr:M20/M25/M40 family metallo-hydrolase [Ardenticatenaceae bacterium]HBY98775.1 peptidase M20 [Chloroflexota bacterium]